MVAAGEAIVLRAKLQMQLDQGKITIDQFNRELGKLGDAYNKAETAKGKFDRARRKSEKNAKQELNHVKAMTKGTDSLMKSMLKASAVTKAASMAYNTLKKAMKATWEYTKELTTSESLVQSAIVATGKAAGKTTEDIDKMAVAMSEFTRFSKAANLRGMSVMLTFPKIAGEQFDRAVKSAQDFATATGRTLPDAMRGLGKALNDPIRGTELLQEAGINFTAALLEQVRALDKAGKSAEAQNLILDLMEERYQGAAKAAGEDFVGALARVENQALQTGASLMQASGEWLQNFDTITGISEELLASLRDIDNLTKSREGEGNGLFAESSKYAGEYIVRIRQIGLAALQMYDTIEVEEMKLQDRRRKAHNEALERNKTMLENAAKKRKEESDAAKLAEDIAAGTAVSVEKYKELVKLSESWENKTKTANEKFRETVEHLKEAHKFAGMSYRVYLKSMKAAEDQRDRDSGKTARLEEEKKVADKLEEARKEKNRKIREDVKKAAEARVKAEEQAAKRVQDIWNKHNPFSNYGDKAYDILKDLGKWAIDPAAGIGGMKELRSQMELEGRGKFGDKGFTPSTFSSAQDMYSSISQQAGTQLSESEKIQTEMLEESKTYYKEELKKLDQIIALAEKGPSMIITP